MDQKRQKDRVKIEAKQQKAGKGFFYTLRGKKKKAREMQSELLRILCQGNMLILGNRDLVFCYHPVVWGKARFPLQAIKLILFLHLFFASLTAQCNELVSTQIAYISSFISKGHQLLIQFLSIHCPMHLCFKNAHNFMLS